MIDQSHYIAILIVAVILITFWIARRPRANPDVESLDVDVCGDSCVHMKPCDNNPFCGAGAIPYEPKREDPIDLPISLSISDQAPME